MRTGMGFDLGRGRLLTSGGPPPVYSPLSEPGCVLLFEADDVGVTTTSATFASGTDFGAWTKTDTVTPNADGARDLLTSTATTALVTQAIGNVATNQAVQITARVKRVSSDWIYIQTAASAVARVWFNINTGTVGTTGSSISNVSITSLGSGEWQLALTSSAASAFGFAHADGDGVLTNTIGHSFLASEADVSVTQMRCSGFTDQAPGGAAWAQATVNTQPLLVPNTFGSLPGLVFAGSQRLVTTAAAILAAVGGGGAFTLVTAHKVTSLDVPGTMLGGGNAGVASNDTIVHGQWTTGLGCYVRLRTGTTGTTVTWSGPSTVNTAAHALVQHSADGNEVFQALDGGTETSATFAADPINISQVAIGMRPDSSPDNGFIGSIGMIAFYSGNLDTAAIGRVVDYCRTKWGTP